MPVAEVESIENMLRLGDILAKHVRAFDPFVSQAIPLLESIKKNTEKATKLSAAQAISPANKRIPVSPQTANLKKSTQRRSMSGFGSPAQPKTVTAPSQLVSPGISPQIEIAIPDVASEEKKSRKTPRKAKTEAVKGKDARKSASQDKGDQDAKKQPQPETASQRATADTKERKSKEKNDKKFLDAAGAATGGVFWGAAMEMKKAAEGMKGDDADKGLLESVKKFVKDKTGITKVQETFGAAKQKAVEKVRSLTGKEKLPEDYKRDKDDRLRDAKSKEVGREDVQPKDSGEQVEKLGAITDVLQSSEKEDEKRHGEMIKALAGGGAAATAGGGLLGALGGKGKGKGKGKGGRRGRRGRRGKLGKIGGIAAAALGGGGLLSLFGGDSEETLPDMAVDAVSEKAVSKTVAPKAGKVAGKGASKMFGKGASKALSIGSKGLRALGPVAAIASAGFDAYQGWNDEEMQAKAFGLEKGQKATTGQKAASSAANVLDMGGLVSGGLSMLGVETSTADFAKGIHGFFGGEDKKKGAKESKGLGGLMKALGPIGAIASAGFDAYQGWNDEDEAESAKMSIAKPEKVESAKEVVERSKSLAQAETRKEDGNLSKQIEKLVDSIKQDKSKKGGETMADISPIATEFDDAMLVLMAHDRI